MAQALLVRVRGFGGRHAAVSNYRLSSPTLARSAAEIHDPPSHQIWQSEVERIGWQVVKPGFSAVERHWGRYGAATNGKRCSHRPCPCREAA
eukprot:COSAG04_NODE_2123_length_4747_cov_3.237470_3_plen_92_part_00